jgi:hypothetical protein
MPRKLLRLAVAPFVIAQMILEIFVHPERLFEDMHDVTQFDPDSRE